MPAGGSRRVHGGKRRCGIEAIPREEAKERGEVVDTRLTRKASAGRKRMNYRARRCLALAERRMGLK